MEIVCIVGARPQFVKLAPFARALEKKECSYKILHTGQHYDTSLSDVFFKDLEIKKPDFKLNIGSDSQAKQTAKMMIEIEKILISLTPDWVVLFGDTNSTLAGSLASSKLNLKTAHIEAGLRSYNRMMPEEINRIVADQLSDLLFAPSDQAYDNLTKEGMEEKTIRVGDLMADNIYHVKNIINEQILEKYKISENEYYVATIHRPYNTDSKKRLEWILNEINSINQTVIFPIHPRTKKMMVKYNLWKKDYENIIIIDSVGFVEFQTLQSKASAIITDSGGIQKEAYLWRKPCFTIRTETEWTETLEFGWNTLVKPIETKLEERISKWIEPENYPLLYGDGNASVEIVEAIEKYK